MDTFDSIATKIEVRKFASDKPIPGDAISKIMEAARLTGSSMNKQHWRFIVVKDKTNLRRLADDSITGPYVAGAGFAVIILTDPKVPGHTIDAGRALQDMQLAAWNMGVGSAIFTGIKEDKLRKDYGIPENLEIDGVACFGYPDGNITGRKKDRKPLNEIAFGEKFGNSLVLK